MGTVRFAALPAAAIALLLGSCSMPGSTPDAEVTSARMAEVDAPAEAGQ